MEKKVGKCNISNSPSGYIRIFCAIGSCEKSRRKPKGSSPQIVGGDSTSKLRWQWRALEGRQFTIRHVQFNLSSIPSQYHGCLLDLYRTFYFIDFYFKLNWVAFQEIPQNINLEGSIAPRMDFQFLLPGHRSEVQGTLSNVTVNLYISLMPR